MINITTFQRIAFAVAVLLFAACASQPEKLEVAPEEWKFKDRAIYLELRLRQI